MAFCTNCGKPMEDSFEFCIHCGAARVQNDVDKIAQNNPVIPLDAAQTPATSSEDFMSYTPPAENGDYQPYATTGNYTAQAPADQYSSSSKKTGTTIIIIVIALIFALIGTAVFIIGSLIGNGGGGGGQTSHADLQKSFNSFLNGVENEDPMAMALSLYEIQVNFSSSDDIADYLADDVDEYGYDNDAQQVDDWFDIFVYNFSDYEINEGEPLYYIYEGVDAIEIIDFTGEVPTSYSDGDMVACTATVKIDGSKTDGEYAYLSFYMACSDSDWFLVFSWDTIE